MYLSRVQITNFRNFTSLDARLTGNVVIVGENRVGKSNLILALRLVLDISLPDSARQLKLTDICDGCDISTSPQVAIHLDFSDFDNDVNLIPLLTDYRLASDHTIARLSYIFRKKADVTEPPKSEADYEFKVFGGGDETRYPRAETRRRICLDLLHALRDAESDLGSWRSSPLRPLLEDAIGKVAKTDLDAIASEIGHATSRLGNLVPIKSLESELRTEIATLAGPQQDIKAKLGFVPSDPLRLFRSIGLFIDDGKRGISDASLGSANLAFLALKLAEFAWRRMKNERNYTIVCVEEPEAHLHPHMQRSVFQKLFSDTAESALSLLLTTHSPNVASVAPIKSIVLLKTAKDKSTKAYSLAQLKLDSTEFEDLQRYLDSTRAEILFSRGVIFVEGDAEEALLPAFARSLGYNLDELGISVCNVGGTHFRPYVKLAEALSLPFSVITDWDPLDGAGPPLGRQRAIDLIDDILSMLENKPWDDKDRADFAALGDPEFRHAASEPGIFLNESTLEVEIATSAVGSTLLAVLDAEHFGKVRRERLARWKADPSSVDAEQLLAMVADVGKGRLAGRLAAKAVGLHPPAYIAAAIKHVAANV